MPIPVKIRKRIAVKHKLSEWNRFQKVSKKLKVPQDDRKSLFSQIRSEIGNHTEIVVEKIVKDRLTKNMVTILLDDIIKRAVETLSGSIEGKRYREIAKLNGKQRITFSNGASYEVDFTGMTEDQKIYAFKNIVEDSEELGEFFKGLLTAKFTPLSATASGTSVTGSARDQLFLNAKPYGDSKASHCVGKDGICKLIRSKAEKYKKQKIEENKGRGGNKTKDGLLAAQRKLYNKKTKLAQELEDLFFQEYPEGIHRDDLEMVCKKYNIKGSIKLPIFQEEWYFNREATKPNASFRFINVAKDHVEICYSEDDIIYLPSEEALAQKFKECQEIDGNKNMIKVYLLSNTIMYAFHYANDIYCLEEYNTFFDRNSPMRKWLDGLSVHKISSKSPYYDFIKQATRVPCHVQRNLWLNVEELVERKKGGLADAHLRVMDRSHTLYAQDMRKCYTQFRHSPLYDGFPGQPNYMDHDPGDKWKSELGWWYIKTDLSLPFCNNLNGYWTSIHLRFFAQQGIEFKVLFGMWSKIRANVREMPIPDKTAKSKMAYVIAIGMMIREKNLIKEHWYDPENILERDYNDKNCFKLQKYKCDEWFTNHVIASYIYAYANTQVWQKAIDTEKAGHQVFAIKIDAIISTGQFPESELWKASEPFDVKASQMTIWTPSIVNNFTADPKPNFPVPWAKTKYDKDFEHVDFGQHQWNFLVGPGGAGKTYTIGHVLEALDPIYFAPTKKLRDEKKDLFRRSYCLASLPQIKVQTLPGVIVVDEIGLCSKLEHHGNSKSDPETYVINWARQNGIRVFFVGDQAQLNSEYSHPDLWDLPVKIDASIIEFTKDRRSVTAKSVELKKKIREWTMLWVKREIPYPKVCLEIRKLLQKHLKKATKTQRETLPSIRYYADTESRKNGNSDRWLTIDKLQGSTISSMTVIVVNSASGRSIIQQNFPETVYTMISRFTDVDLIRYVDNTNYTHILEREGIL